MWKNSKRQVLYRNDYIVLSPGEKQLLLLKSMLVVSILNLCFYRHVAAFLPLLLPGRIYYRKEAEELLQKKTEDVRLQFKEMLFLAVAGQRAGYSVENAFFKGYEDLQSLYGRDSAVCKMLREVKSGTENNIPMGELWKRIGEKSGIVEIAEFASVFIVAKESGGGMAAMLENTAQTIAEKAETKKEIAVLLSAKRLEQKIMNLMPCLLLLYMNAASPGYFGALYGSVEGVLIMTVCLSCYLFVFGVSEKIAKIEI